MVGKDQFRLPGGIFQSNSEKWPGQSQLDFPWELDGTALEAAEPCFVLKGHG